MDSILATVRKACNLQPSDEDFFYSDIIDHINSYLSIVTQLGVGPDEGFQITGFKEKWADLLLNDNTLNMVKAYVKLKVQLIFDPPLNASVLAAKEREADRLESRINSAADYDFRKA